MTPYIGQSLPRVEDRRLLTGQGRYTADISLEGEVHCAFLRSPHAHARIESLDATAALRAPGVLAVLTGADYRADGLAPIVHNPNPIDALDVSMRAFAAPPGAKIVELPHWPLAGDAVRHVGEAVAAVIAASAGEARDAAELIEVGYQPLPAVVSPAEAVREGAPQLWPEAPRNLCFSVAYGDREATRAAIAAAHCVVRHRFVNNRIVNAQMEPRSAIGAHDAAGNLHTLISGSQGVHLQKVSLAAVFKVPPDQVRVICPDVGGGFGPRTNLYPEQVVVVWAARRLGRPVKWIADRSESFLADYQGRDSVAEAVLALDAGGHILGYEVEWFGNIGAHTVSYVPLSNGRRVLSTVYKVPAAHALMQAVLTNTVPTAPYRGAGRPEAIHMIERLLDMAARRMGIDRVGIRSRNVVTRDLLPWRNAMGLVYDSGDFAGYMARVLELADWKGFPARKREAAARGRLAGIGLANHVESPVGMPAERAVVTVNGDDETVEVIVGTQSTGQGHETTFAQVIADLLGVPFEAVRIRSGDSAFVTLGGGTHSDRSMRLVGTLLVRASADILDQARELAAALLEVAAADLVYEAGAFQVAGTDRALTLHEIARAARAASDDAQSGTAQSRRIPLDMRRALAVTNDFRGRIPAFPAGAAVCELEIDPETGAVDITRYTTVEDVGQAINPMIVRGQTHGGIAQGVGQALHEGVAHDPDNAQMLTGSFMDYGICRADDLPSFEVGHAEDPTAGNPLRVKGGGEGGIMPATAAVINALCDALSDAGVDDLPMPATQAAVWSAMKKSRPAPKATAGRK